MAIYDCFTFYNEIDLLKIRMKLLAPYVDKFVIVEMSKTQNAQEKPFYFKENESLFEEYKEQIISLQIIDVPEHKTTWDLENYQRNCIMKALTNCKSDDIIMISDLDEIPRPEIIKNINNQTPKILSPISLYTFAKNLSLYFTILDRKLLKIRKPTLNIILDYTPITLEQDICMYYFNNVCQSKKWTGTTIAKYMYMPMPQKMRDMRGILPRIKKAGWHFTYFGGEEKIRNKLNSLCEWEDDYRYREKIVKKISELGGEDNYISWCYNKGIPVFGWDKYSIIPNNRIDIPEYDQLINEFPQFYKEIDR